LTNAFSDDFARTAGGGSVGGPLKIIEHRQQRLYELCLLAARALIRGPVQTLARFVGLVLKLLAQLIKARLHLENFLFRGFGAGFQLFHVTGFEIGSVSDLVATRIRFVIELNAAAIGDANLRLGLAPPAMISTKKILSHKILVFL
jgi:hypothetical protein